jgi:aldose 1-epimerase
MPSRRTAATSRALLTLALVYPAAAANYTAERATVEGVEIIRLTDAAHDVQVSIAPSFGNNAFEMKVAGKNIFWTPTTNPVEMKRQPRHLGNPFLAPWANRLDHEGFWANDKEYLLNPALKNYGKDGFGQPIHGLLTFSTLWEVVDLHQDGESASVTSRLEFWRHPELMAQFPFAHTIEMTYRLHAGTLEVVTAIRNLGAEPMPLSIGFHPYFRLHDAPRDDWKVTLPVREHLTLSSKLIPTGESTPAGDLAVPFSLKGRQVDDVFSGLVAGAGGHAEFSVEGVSEKIVVSYGPKYPVAVVFAPRGRDFICFEPMTGPTNAFNLAHAGVYKQLQSIPANGEWKESFWVSANGFRPEK